MIRDYEYSFFVVNIRTTGVKEAEPVWGPLLLALFVVTMLFVLLNVFIGMVLFAYHEAKDAVADENFRGELQVAAFYYYKLLHVLNRIRKVNYETMGHEASQFNTLEGWHICCFCLISFVINYEYLFRAFDD